MGHYESKGDGWDFWEVYESFLSTLGVEICLSSSKSFFDHCAWGDFFLNDLLGSFVLFFFFLAYASPQPPIFFLLVTSLN